MAPVCRDAEDEVIAGGAQVVDDETHLGRMGGCYLSL